MIITEIEILLKYYELMNGDIIQTDINHIIINQHKIQSKILSREIIDILKFIEGNKKNYERVLETYRERLLLHVIQYIKTKLLNGLSPEALPDCDYIKEYIENEFLNEEKIDDNWIYNVIGTEILNVIEKLENTKEKEFAKMISNTSSKNFSIENSVKRKKRSNSFINNIIKTKKSEKNKSFINNSSKNGSLFKKSSFRKDKSLNKTNSKKDFGLLNISFLKDKKINVEIDVKNKKNDIMLFDDIEIEEVLSDGYSNENSLNEKTDTINDDVTDDDDNDDIEYFKSCGTGNYMEYIIIGTLKDFENKKYFQDEEINKINDKKVEIEKKNEWKEQVMKEFFKKIKKTAKVEKEIEKIEIKVEKVKIEEEISNNVKEKNPIANVNMSKLFKKTCFLLKTYLFVKQFDDFKMNTNYLQLKKKHILSETQISLCCLNGVEHIFGELLTLLGFEMQSSCKFILKKIIKVINLGFSCEILVESIRRITIVLKETGNFENINSYIENCFVVCNLLYKITDFDEKLDWNIEKSNGWEIGSGMRKHAVKELKLDIKKYCIENGNLNDDEETKCIKRVSFGDLKITHTENYNFEDFISDVKQDFSKQNDIKINQII